jgi:hypothetical protein
MVTNSQINISLSDNLIVILLSNLIPAELKIISGGQASLLVLKKIFFGFADTHFFKAGRCLNLLLHVIKAGKGLLIPG